VRDSKVGWYRITNASHRLRRRRFAGDDRVLLCLERSIA